MMAPHYERLRILYAAIECAGEHLDDAIDRIEVRNGQVLFWAGAQTFVVTYEYQNAYSPEGAPMPGSGHWQVVPGKLRGRRSLRALVRRWIGGRDTGGTQIPNG